MKLTKRETFLFIAYIGILFAGISYYLIFRFGFTQYKILNEQIEGVEKALSKTESILSSKDKIEQQYNEFEKKLSAKEIKQAVSTDILQEIKGKAATSGLNVLNIKPFTLKDENFYGEFDVRLETQGHLTNLGLFLYQLDDSPYIFTIKHMQLNAQSHESPLKIQLLLSAMLSKE